jgi:hypothetical protein
VLVIVDVAALVVPWGTEAATVCVRLVVEVTTLEREYWLSEAAAGPEPVMLHGAAGGRERVFAVATVPTSAAGTSKRSRTRASSMVTEEKDAEPAGLEMTAEIKRIVEMVDTMVSWSAARLDVKNQLVQVTSPVVTLEVSIGALRKLNVEGASWMYFRGVVSPNCAVL